MKGVILLDVAAIDEALAVAGDGSGDRIVTVDVELLRVTHPGGIDSDLNSDEFSDRIRAG